MEGTDESALRGRVPTSATEVRGRENWGRLFSRPGVQDALDEVVRALDPRGAVEWVLEVPGQPPRGVAARRPASPDARSGEQTAVVGGSPEWRVRLKGGDSAGSVEETAQRAAAALEAWRAAREERDRSDARLNARTLELDLLQDLGRAAAEARTLEGLFRGVCHALHRAGEDDAIAVAHGVGSCPEVLTYLIRPLSREVTKELARHAGGILGWTAESAPRQRVERLDLYDGHRSARSTFDPADLVVLPLLRRGSAVASFTVLPSRPAGEDRLRLLFGAANQMAVHLDRILTVREAEEGRFRSVIDSMPQAVLLLDSELRIVSSNPSARRLLEPSLGSASGAVVNRVGSLDVEALRDALRAGAERARMGEARFENGTVIDATISAFEDSVHGRGGYVLVLSDVTEKSRLHERLAQSEKLSSLGELISGIAHELNNPLASVLGYAELLRGSTTDERLARKLEIIDREARRCRKIVQNLLSFARRHEPERRAISLNETVQEASGILAYQLRVGGIETRIDLDPQLPAIHADPHQLQQALLNLMTNALHALHGTPGGILEIRTRAHGGQGVALEVKDNGPGIPEEIRSRIFDPFFTTKGSGQGTGLGLSIVYGIVTAHGGSVEMVAPEEGGSIFRLYLPLGVPAAGPTPAEAPEPGRPSPGRVLVVDDEESLARLVAEALEADGHKAVAALGRGDAIARLEAEDFDLVICDLKMPGLGAEELCAELERIRPGSARRLLLVTGDTLSAEPERLAARKGLALLHKPFDLDELRRAVRIQLAHERGPCGT